MGFMMPRLMPMNTTNTQRTPDQLNPWNPYFRTYGRVYPYNVATTYPEPEWNHSRTLYSLLGQPASNANECNIPFSTYRSNLYSTASPHSSLVSRPRSTHRHMRTPNRPTERNSVAPVISIELSSDEDDLSSESVRALDGSDASSVSSHATRPIDMKDRLLNGFASTSARKTEPKPIFFDKPKHSSRTDSVTSTESIDVPPLNFSNRLKRARQTTTQGDQTSKVFRINNRPIRRAFEEPQSDESIDSNNRPDIKPNLNVIEEIERNADSTCPDDQPDADSDGAQNLVNLKREVKKEPSTMSECSEDTKGNLQSLLISIKKE